MTTMHVQDAPRALRPSIFGTDGIRERPGHGLLTLESVERLAGATAHALSLGATFPEDFPAGGGDTILVGRDSRASGESIGGALLDGFRSRGYRVVDLGVLPTPGVAFISATWPRVALGIVVSASHNPAEYNGIKFVSPTGAKISPAFEQAVSDAYWEGRAVVASSRGTQEARGEEALQAYISHLARTCRRPERLRGRAVALDTANGATCRAACELFHRLGLKVTAIGNEPDGHNINRGCGALHPEGLRAHLAAERADFGFCFDGDGDRMIPVTGQGRILDGDHVLYVAGTYYDRMRRLPHRCVVATVMSNIGLEIALRHAGIQLLRTDVGDRNVYLVMVEKGHPVGGEQSGHIILLEDSRTGDGILAAVRMLDMLEGDSLDMEAEASPMRRYPQILRNVHVSERRPLAELPRLGAEVERGRVALGTEGRILVRYSGTEPLLRIMVEGPDLGRIEAIAAEICNAVEPGD